MTTAYRDTAQRCRRCERFVKGCAPFTVTEQLELGTVEVAHVMLCQRCRSDMHDVVRRTLAGAEVREVIR